MRAKRRATRSSVTPSDTAASTAVDDPYSADSIDSDWHEDSESSVESQLSEFHDSNDDPTNEVTLLKDPIAVSTPQETKIKKKSPPKKKRSKAEPVQVWEAPSDLDELDKCSDLETLNSGKRKKKFNAESRLRILHPEIGTAWRDLKQKSSDCTHDPNQPSDVTLKLLPFQLEGVSWLRHQEEGIFHGGILADEMVIFLL